MTNYQYHVRQAELAGEQRRYRDERYHLQQADLYEPEPERREREREAAEALIESL